METIKKIQLLLAAGLVCLIAWGIWVAMTPMARENFDSQRWIADTNLRCGMTSDLLKRHARPGMSREQLLALLGPPEKDGSTKIEYGLGLCQSGMDEDLLTFYFDSQERLTIYNVSTH
jgi:hypothetical protein